jgi:hypothetical protein
MTHAIWATVSLGKGISKNARPHSVEGGTYAGAACTSGAPVCTSVGAACTTGAAGSLFLVATAFLAAALGFLVFAAFLPAAPNFRVLAAFFAAELRPLGMGTPLLMKYVQHRPYNAQLTDVQVIHFGKALGPRAADATPRIHSSISANLRSFSSSSEQRNISRLPFPAAAATPTPTALLTHRNGFKTV